MLYDIVELKKDLRAGDYMTIQKGDKLVIVEYFHKYHVKLAGLKEGGTGRLGDLITFHLDPHSRNKEFNDQFEVVGKMKPTFSR